MLVVKPCLYVYRLYGKVCDQADNDKGNANWLTVGAVVAFFLSMCTSFCGACGRFASGRAAGEKVRLFTSCQSGRSMLMIQY
jgi:hypothetical protein